MDREDRQRRMEDLWLVVLCATVVVCAHVLELTQAGRASFRIPGTGIGITPPESCPSKLIWGFPCPGCGLTRSFVAMSGGEVLRAHGFNPMGPVLYVLCWLQIPFRIGRLWGFDPPGFGPAQQDRAVRPVLWTILIGFGVTWILRIVVEAPWSS